MIGACAGGAGPADNRLAAHASASQVVVARVRAAGPQAHVSSLNLTAEAGGQVSLVVTSGTGSDKLIDAVQAPLIGKI